MLVMLSVNKPWKRTQEVHLETQANPCFQKIHVFFFAKKYFFIYVLDRFDALILKMIFRK